METSDPSDATSHLGLAPVTFPTVGAASRTDTQAPASEATGPASTTDLPTGRARYETGDELGRGGWGYVVAAHDAQLDRPVAVKQISSKLAGRLSVHDRFQNEARLTAQLQHPGIVPVHETGLAADGAPFYVMKLLDGRTLKEEIAARQREEDHHAGGYSVELLQRFMDVCNTVAYAHNQGVVHRDLKPANVMVGGFGETIVVDWGLATRVGESDVGVTPEAPSGDPVPETPDNNDATLAGGVGSAPPVSATPARRDPTSAGAGQGGESRARSGTLVGTPAYMSPEQASGGGGLTPAADIFALGVILYEILTGENPFRAEDVGSTLERVRRGEYRPPRLVRRRVPRALDAICRAAMAPQPEDRYAQAEQIVADLQSFLAGDDVSVYRAPWWERAMRWCRRRPALCAGTLGSLVVLTVASVVFGAAISRAHRAEQQARVVAEAAKADALDRLADARSAGDAWLIDLSGALQFYPGMEALREELLAKALEHYEDLASATPNADAAKDHDRRLELARCQLRIGDLHRLLGNEEDAYHAYRSSLGLLDTDRSKQPAWRVERINAGVGLRLLGNVSDQVVTAMDLDWLRREVESRPTEKRFRLAASALARWGLAVNRAATAEADVGTLIEAEACAKELVGDRGDERDHQLLQTVRDELAAHHERTGDRAAVARVWTAEVRRLTERVERSPQRPELRQSLAFTQMKLAGSDGLQGYRAKAEERYGLAVDQLDRAWALADVDRFYERSKAISHANLARLQAGSSVDAEATRENLSAAIQGLRTVTTNGAASADDLVRLAECYESAAVLGRRLGADTVGATLDTADRCYRLVDESVGCEARDNATWARLLARRAEWRVAKSERDGAQADLKGAHERLELSVALGSDLPAHRRAANARLAIELTRIEGDLLAALGDERGALRARERYRDALLEAATAEKHSGEPTVFPRAMLTWTDFLLERDGKPGADSADDWLQSMRTVFPPCEDGPDWRQRRALAALVAADSATAATEADLAIALDPDNLVSRIAQATSHGLIGETSAQDAATEIRSLLQAMPGDERAAFWAEWALRQLANEQP